MLWVYQTLFTLLATGTRQLIIDPVQKYPVISPQSVSEGRVTVLRASVQRLGIWIPGQQLKVTLDKPPPPPISLTLKLCHGGDSTSCQMDVC